MPLIRPDKSARQAADAIEDTYWIVWREGGGAPVVKHENPGLATKEAERLARAHPGERFVVLQAVRARQVKDLECIEFDDIPF